MDSLSLGHWKNIFMDNRIVRLSFILTILLIGLFSMSSAFADEPSALSFNIVHLIDLNTEYHFVFKDSSDEAVTSVALTEEELNEDFVRLYLQHNSNILVKGLTVSASDLKTSDESATYPYTMSISDKNGNAVEWVADPEGHGAGYAHIIPKTTVFRYKDTLGEVKLADFSIDLSVQEDVPFGSYSGTMSLYYVVL